MDSPPIRYEPDVGPPVPRTETEIRAQVIQVCHMVWQRGFVAANDGNISARLDGERVLCTPSGYSKGILQPEHLVVIDMEGRPLEAGPGLRPSSEILLHLEAYRQRPDVRAVVHAHPPTAIALSVLDIPIGGCLIPDAILALGRIPYTEYATPASAAGAQVIREPIQRYDALVLRRHGSVTVGISPLEAYLRLEKVEQIAQITKAIHELGQPIPLPASEVRRLLEWRREKGLLRPGQWEEICAECGVDLSP